MPINDVYAEGLRRQEEHKQLLETIRKVIREELAAAGLTKTESKKSTKE